MSAPRLAACASVVIGLVATGSEAGAEAVLAPDWTTGAGSAIVRSCRMAPNTATNATITSVQAAAIKRMAASLEFPLFIDGKFGHPCC